MPSSANTVPFRAESFDEAIVDGVIVAQMAGRGVEMILGARRDPVFGPVVMLGFGGIHVEVLKDISLRRAPLCKDDVEEMIAELRAKALFDGVRGAEPSDVAGLKAAVLTFSKLAASDLVESMEINPLLVMPQGLGVLALDCLIELRS